MLAGEGAALSGAREPAEQIVARLVREAEASLAHASRRAERVFPRQLEYLVALERERHFGRAARACHVSQPTLSTGLRKLEAELGVPLVRRGQRFEGFTREGERVVLWAHRILADYDGLGHELSQIRGGLEGTLRIGAIPTSVPAISLVTSPFCERHPLMRVEVDLALLARDRAPPGRLRARRRA